MLSSSHQHVVQFYEDEHFLCAAAARFLAAGLSEAQPSVVIATAPHRDAIARHLASLNVNIARAPHKNRVAWLDASELLSKFMVGVKPDAELFREHVGGALERVSRKESRDPVRAYGEMVNVLWEDGNPNAAMRVEELWNDLAKSHPLSLLCAYGMGYFRKESQWPQFQAVCGYHTRVIPTEQYSQITDDEMRLREISLLQQRARALQTEIDHRKELEQALRQALADRERAQVERERLLAAEQAARADAESASRLKDEFLAVLSHELGTPLNAILGWTQIASGQWTDAATVRRALEIIERNANIQLHVVNDLLDVSRIVTGKMAVTMAPVDLGELLTMAVETVRPAASLKSLDLGLTLADDARVVTGDAARLQQVLWNLMSNAVKFTPSGGRVDVALDCVGAAARVTVRDTGAGIAAKFLPHVFDRFRQEDTGTTRKHGGLGLGLSVVRYLVEAHGGTVSAESEGEGLGALFTVMLPLRALSPEELESPEPLDSETSQAAS